jgi:diadenylate cyclase
VNWGLESLQFGWRDALDIVVVAVVLYNILKLIRGTRAMQMSVGLMLLAGAYVMARALELLALERLAEEIFFYLPFAVVVLFQHELRAALANFGRNPLVSIFAPRGNRAELEVLANAAAELATRRIGALIVVERTQSLRMYAQSGKQLDAVISAELLLNIFTPNTPLHDGAVIIQESRITAAAVFLPLSSSSEVPAEYGTRHRAALGVSEETDAVVIIISEENGSIALAEEGRLHFDLSRDRLHQLLQRSVALSRSAA